jgi:hypothetical protein
LQESQSLAVTHVGPAASGITGGSAQPLSMVVSDIDRDGVEDLLVGYSTPTGGVVVLHRGNLDAFAPQSDASFQAIANSQFPSPFLSEARAFAVPVTPDFMAVGDFTGHGVTDLAVAARGGSTIYILAGDGKGHFQAGDTINLPGGVTALAADRFGKIQSALLVGVSSGRQSFLAVYGLGGKGLAPLAALPLQAPASNILFGEFGDLGPDAALLSGGQVFILRSSNMQLVNIGLPVRASAFALGFFLFDRNGGSQIAVLGVDGSIQIAVRNEFDPRTYTNEDFQAIRQARLRGETPPLVPAHTFAGNGWRIAEGFPSLGSVAAGQAPVFFRTRISVNGADDILWLSAAGGQMVLISHPDQQSGAATFVPGQVSVKPYNGSPVHGLPMRTNADGRFGIVALHQGEIAPAISAPIPDPVFTVNRTDDPTPPATITNACNGVANDCSLREAILRASGDTVMVPAGTYTLSIAKVANDCTGKFGALSVDHDATIIGSVDGTGKPTSIIQAGTTAYNAGTPNGVDMVMNVNEDLATAACPSTNATASLSNLILQNGHNRGTHGNDGDGGCMEFDTGTSGTATLTLTNVILQNCNTTQGSGGGLASFNFLVATGTGQAVIINSIIQGNSVTDNNLPGPNTAGGGGIWVTDPSRMTMTNSQVLNNLATQTSGGAGPGGGLFILSKGTPGETPQTQIHSSTISGNQSSIQGGGINDSANVLIDSGTTISGNKSSSNGGGLFVNTPAGNSATLSKVTIINNQSTGAGGGIATGAIGAGPVTFTFSRLKGNTAGTTGPNLENLGSAVTATHNWWATNTAGNTIHTTAGTTTFDPFLVLTHTAAPNLIRIGDPSGLTADFLHDNHGSTAGITASNLDVLSGLPITFNNANHGTISNAQPAIGNQVAITSVSQTGCTPTTFQCTATVTVTTTTPHNFSVAQNVTIAGVTDPSYDGVFAITSTPTPTTFTYSTQDTASSSSSGGTASVPTGTATATYTATSGGIDSVHATVDGVAATATITVLFPPSIAKAFTATHIPVFTVTPTTTTLTFTITNPNTANGLNGLAFTDNLPSGLAVANTPAVSNTCNGSVTAAAGTGTISLSGGTITFNGSGTATCTVSVDVKGLTDGIQNNTSGAVTATDVGGLSGNTANASITVINPPQIAKAFGAATIPLSGTTSNTFTISSSNANLTLNGIAFNDSLPSGLVNATPANLNSNCGGSATAADGGTSVSLSGVTLAPGASCTVSLNVQGTTAGIKNNSVQVTSTDVGGLTGNTGNASITVVGPPTIAKAFGAATIPLNGSTSLSFTINNPNTTVSLSGVAFSDTLPAGLVVSTPNGLTGTCGGGSITATAGTNTISLSGGTLTASGSCTFAVNVTGTAAGAQNNTTGAVTSTEGGTGNTAAASVTVVAPPSIAKAFNPTNIGVGANSQLTFTITNPGANAVALTGVGFTDTLPSGLLVATPNGLTNSCGGTATAAAGGTSISLSGGTVAAAGACTVVVNINGAAAGQYTNTSGAVTSTNGGTGNTATANLNVASPPVIGKVFGVLSIPLGGSTSLTFTITNPNTIGLTGLAFTDPLPAGLVVATPPGTTNSCGGTVTAVAGSGSISLSGGTVAASPATCTVGVNVTGVAAGVAVNTSGPVSATEGGTGNHTVASITVVAPPVDLKQFAPASVGLNGTSTMTITIQNPNGIPFTFSFTDNFPAGITVGGTPGLANTCGGTATANANATSVSLAGGSLLALTSCTFVVTVAGVSPGDWTNSVTVNSTEGGAGNAASAVLQVGPQPTFTKAFTGGTVALNGTTVLTLTIVNPVANATSLTNLAFTDTLPAGLQIFTPVDTTGTTCDTAGGDVSVAGTVTPDTGSTPNSISLSGLTLVGGTTGCTVAIKLTGITPGTQNNSVQISSTEGGNGPTATATIDVVAPPTLAKAFNPATIPLNGTTVLTFTITNPVGNAVAENGVAFSDTLPTNLVVATPNGLTNSCGGTATATAGSASIDLVGGTIAVNSSCTVSVNVTGAVAGQYPNTSGNVSSTNGGTGNSASATLTIDAPPTITKAFGAATIPLNGTTSLTLNITNPNSTGLTGVGFSDSLPSGLVVANPPSVTNSCSGGSVTASAGAGSVGLSGASLGGSGSCTVSVNVQGTTAGIKNNSVQATSNEGGTGAPGNASITVVAPPTIIKAFGAASIPLNGSTSLTFTLNNPNNPQSLSGVAFSDTLPAGLIISTPNGLTGSCGSGTITATQGTNTISLSGGTLAGPGSCSFSVNVTGTAPGQQINTTSTVSSTEGGTGTTAATASITVVAPPSIAKAFNPNAIALNGVTTLTITITNPAANTVAEAGVAFSDSLPTGLTVFTPNGLTNSCGGTASATGGTTLISLVGGSIAVNSSCTVVVNITGNASGQFTNTSGAVSSTNGGTGNTASASLLVGTPQTVSKSFGATQIPVTGVTSLTFNIGNPNASTTLTGLSFTDNLPAGLVVANPNGLTNNCGGTATAVVASGQVSLAGGTLAPTTSCVLSVNVQGTTAGIKNNSVSVTSNEGGTSVANATITVVGPPALNKSFGAASVALGVSTSLSFGVSNPNSTVGLTGIGFTDTLPAGLVIATPNGFSGSCGGGTITATAGSSVISLFGGSLAAGGSCAFSMNVTGIAAGTEFNTTSAITSNEGGSGQAATASIAVVAPPFIAKFFAPTGIQPNGVSFLTISITNPPANTVALQGVAFTDSFPPNLVVATPNNLNNTCGGTPVATSGTGTVSLSGGSIAVNSSCTVQVLVTATPTGSYVNSTGPVSATNGGTGGSASATLSVARPPTISKLFLPDTTGQNQPVALSFTIQNSNSNSTPPDNDMTLTGISFTDALPAGLVVANPTNISNDCGGTLTAVPGSGFITLSGGTIAPAVGLIPRPIRPSAKRGGPPPVATGSCFISVEVLPTASGTLNNTTGPISANESGTGATSNTATLTVTPGPVVVAPTLAKAFGAAQVGVGLTTQLTFAVNNTNASTPLVNINFNDALPSGLVVASPNGLTGTCVTTDGASVIANPGSGSVSLASMNLAAATSCSFSVNVTATSRGTKVNTTGTIVASFDSGGGNFQLITGGTATATINVVNPVLAITKTHTGNFNRGQTGAQYTITVSNVGGDPTVGVVAVTDTLPNVNNTLVAVSISGTGWNCVLATLTCTRADALNAGASYPPITLTVNVPQNIRANVVNTVTVSGGGDQNSHTASDPTHIGSPVQLTPEGSTIAQVVAGGITSVIIDVDSSAGEGTLTLSCSGLPAGAACSFNPPNATALTTPVTVTIGTTLGASARPPDSRPGFGVYAMLFPVFGVLLLGAGAKRDRKRLRRLVVVLGIGLLVSLLTLSGCGGLARTGGTPAAVSTVTVTATSTTTGDSGSTTINLTVLNPAPTAH